MPDRSPGRGSNGYTGGDAASASSTANAGAAASANRGGNRSADLNPNAGAAAAAGANGAAAAAAAASKSARPNISIKPSDLLNKVLSGDKSITNELSESTNEEQKATNHKIPDGITSLQYDDVIDPDGNVRPTAGFSPKESGEDKSILSGEDAPDNEYFSMQQKAFKKEMEAERSRDDIRKDILRAREFNRKRSFGTSTHGNAPYWFEGQRPDATGEIIKHYSTWSASRKENEAFAECWWELSENFPSLDDRFKKPDGKSLWQDVKDTVAGAAIGAAKEAVMNFGMAVSDQVAGLENNLSNSLSMAVDKALAPIIDPVAGFVQDVKDFVYGGIEAVASGLNKAINNALGVNQDVTEIKTYSVPPYALKISRDIEASKGNPAYNYTTEKVAETYFKAIKSEVKKVLESKSSSLYGKLSSSKGDTSKEGAAYALSEAKIIEFVDQYFTDENGDVIPPLVNPASAKVVEEEDYDEFIGYKSENNFKYFAKGLNDPIQGIGEDDGERNPNGPEDTYEVFEELKSHTEGNSELYFARTLEQALNDAKALSWEAAKVLCSTGKAMDDDTVMALMDSTRNRYNVLLQAQNLFEKTTAGQMTMEAINANKPSQLLNKFMLSQDSSNGGKGDVLLAATALMGPQAGSWQQKWNGIYLSQVKNLHKSIWRSETNLGCEPGLIWCLSEFDTRDFDNGITLGSSRLLWSILEDRGAVNVLSSLMSFREESSDYYDKAVTDTKTAPMPMWSMLRFGRNKDGNGQEKVSKVKLYGMESLASMFRVNKTIPSGEVDYFQNGLYHLFFVKPDLNLTENAMALMGYHNHPLGGEIITQLNYNNNDLMPSWGEHFPAPLYEHSGAHPYFSYLFSNLVKSTSIPDLALDTKEGWENTFGGRTQFGTTTRKSYLGNDFSINFYDTKELLLMNIITAWMKYIEIMKEGQGECTRKATTRGTIDYLGALYYFVMEPDNHTIAHWGRYVGIFPTSAPWSNVKLDPSVDIPEFSVNFKSEYHEANDPNILLDFNYIMRLPAYMGDGSSNSGAAAYEKYSRLSSIYTSRGRRSTNDPNLLGGPTRSENRAYVRMTPEKESDSTRSNEKWGFSSTYPFKFLLEFESNMDVASVDPAMASFTETKKSFGFDTSPSMSMNEANNGIERDREETREEFRRKQVAVASINPPDIYNSNAVITYFDALGHQLPESYGSGETIGKNGWVLEDPDNIATNHNVKDKRYGVLISNAKWYAPDDGTKKGKDQSSAQKALGGLVDSSNMAGRVDMAAVGKALGF